MLAKRTRGALVKSSFQGSEAAGKSLIVSEPYLELRIDM